MRFFNTAGPVDPAKHYTLPPLSRLDWDGPYRMRAGEIPSSSSSMRFTAPQTLRQKSQHQGIERHAFNLGAGRQLGVEAVLVRLLHDSGPFHERDEFSDVDRLDRAVGWYGQGFAVSADKDAMARTLLPPVDPPLPRHGPQLVNVPVQRAIPHGFE